MFLLNASSSSFVRFLPFFLRAAALARRNCLAASDRRSPRRFLGMHVALAGATEPKNKALMSTMDPEFFLESYPWWTPIFERFGIGRGGQTSMFGTLVGDGSGACDSGCSVS